MHKMMFQRLGYVKSTNCTERCSLFVRLKSINTTNTYYLRLSSSFSQTVKCNPLLASIKENEQVANINRTKNLYFSTKTNETECKNESDSRASQSYNLKGRIKNYLCDKAVTKGENLFRSQECDFTNQQRTVDVIRSYGYGAEEFTVTTEDGYVLSLTKIQSSATKMPVLMIHGVLAASDQWVLRGPNEDLAFLLADEGHEVWLGDQRGNTFSRKHTYFNTSDESFWDFSFHESALYDLPAFMDAVLRLSSSNQLLYVGHSMGTTVYYVLCSLRPEYNQLIHTAVHLCPVAFRKPLSPLLTLLSTNIHDIANLFRKNGQHEFFRRNVAIQNFGIQICRNKEPLCRYLISQMYGETSAKNATKLITYASSVMSGTSIKNMVHLSQLYTSKNFTQFDYGKRRNYEMYGRKTAPDYPLQRVTTPVILVYSGHDVFVNTQSVSRLAANLPNVISKIYIPKFNHIDFLFSDDAASFVYRRIIKLLGTL